LGFRPSLFAPYRSPGHPCLVGRQKRRLRKTRAMRLGPVVAKNLHRYSLSGDGPRVVEPTNHGPLIFETALSMNPKEQTQKELSRVSTPNHMPRKFPSRPGSKRRARQLQDLRLLARRRNRVVKIVVGHHHLAPARCRIRSTALPDQHRDGANKQTILPRPSIVKGLGGLAKKSLAGLVCRSCRPMITAGSGLSTSTD